MRVVDAVVWTLERHGGVTVSQVFEAPNGFVAGSQRCLAAILEPAPYVDVGPPGDHPVVRRFRLASD
ncbi:MAG TPA: hypothetical protein VFC09_09725 [Candidatus Dormibacteraeota bacterium]|nr:hypothetical protein [Candidatus Dormibacteraeota bacterium]